MPTPRHTPKILMDVNAFILGRGLCIVVFYLPFCGCGDPICFHFVLFALPPSALRLMCDIPVWERQGANVALP